MGDEKKRFDFDEYVIAKFEDEVNLPSVARIVVAEHVNAEAQAEVKRLVKLKADEIVAAEFDRVLLSGPVILADGFGPSKRYESFEELVKEELGKRIKQSRDIDSAIRKAVQQKISDIYERDFKGIVAAIVEKIKSGDAEALK